MIHRYDRPTFVIVPDTDESVAKQDRQNMVARMQILRITQRDKEAWFQAQIEAYQRSTKP
jgi:hypothetical protein